MPAILEQPEDVVAIIHHDAELVLCLGCSDDWFEKHGKWVTDNMTFSPILARNCGIHEKCDGCHSTFLTTEF